MKNLWSFQLFNMVDSKKDGVAAYLHLNRLLCLFPESNSHEFVSMILIPMKDPWERYLYIYICIYFFFAYIHSYINICYTINGSYG